MTEKEIVQKIYEAIKLVDCMQYNPLVDFNYLRAKCAYNIIKNQVEHIEAENAELKAILSKMETVEKELRERLEKAVELPRVECIMTREWLSRELIGAIMFEWCVLYKKGSYLMAEPCLSKGDAEIRLAELKGEEK